MEEEIREFQEYFSTMMQKPIMDLVASYPKSRSLVVDVTQFSRFNYELANALMEKPDHYTKAAEEALLKSVETFGLLPEGFKPKVRFSNLPQKEILVQYLGADHLNKLVQVQGVVDLITDIRPKLQVALWECAFCERTTKNYPDKSGLKPPTLCGNCGKKEFTLLEATSDFVNTQYGQLQDLLERVQGSSTPAHVDLWFEEDLTNVVMPGETVTLTGILRLMPRVEKNKAKSAVYAKAFDVIFVKKEEKEFEEIEISKEEEQKILELSQSPRLREIITESVAPSIWGHTEVKQAIALQLFGGTPDKVLPDGNRVRSDIHVLLIGDPGCLIGDERVVLGNGAIVKLEKMGSKHLQPIDVQILTGQGKNRALATTFHSYESQPIIEVVTESGKCIKGTYNHPLLVVDGMERHWTRLDQLKVGEKLAAVTWIPCTITDFVETNWEPLAHHYGPKTRARLPSKLNPELAGLLGYAVGDGWVTKTRLALDVNSEEQDLIPLLSNFASENFGLTPKIRVEKRVGKKPITIMELHSVDIAGNLQFMREKRVPDLVLKSGNKVASEFLAWLFEADGCVFSKGRGKRAIQLKSSEVELLRDVQVLLLRFGIHSRIVERNLTIRRAESIAKFSEKIGFRSKKKIAKLEQLVDACKNLHHKLGNQLSEKIVSIKKAGVANVFDIEVPEGNRFIANGIISHNTAKSQLLKYTELLAPKCIYVAGRGASGVGLTASAEKDKSGEGWVLKAGALVLASGGLVAIDEFDKMEKEDRSNIHEAMEQQQISIAKAGIVTKFKAKTSILAAANPKYGRFDTNESIVAQFEIPPTLLSRFDLIFTIRDTLDESEDRKKATHILKGLRYAAEKRAGNAPEKEVQPNISNDLLRKYIAYARRTTVPQLNDQAMERIKDYYVELRAMGAKTQTFPVTPRDLEGLVRLSEAAAKMRLSNKVELQDAEYAINLKDFVLNLVFIDKTTGRIDADVIQTGISKSKRDKIFSVLHLVQELEKEYDLVEVGEVVRKAVPTGLDEAEILKILDELKTKGDLYSPKPGFVKTAYKKYG